MRVAIATIALERRGSGDLMLAALAELARQGFRACVGDGGSSDEFVAAVRAMGHDVRQPGRGIRGQIEAALEGASERGSHVLYVESDKLEFVRSALQRTIDEYVARALEYAVGRPRSGESGRASRARRSRSSGPRTPSSAAFSASRATSSPGRR